MGRTDILPPDAARDVVRAALGLGGLFIEKADTPALRMAMDANKNFIFGGLIIFFLFEAGDKNWRIVIFLDKLYVKFSGSRCQMAQRRR